MTSTDDFLAHYGVLGMKWGVRKDRSSKSSKSKSTSTKKVKTTLSSDEVERRRKVKKRILVGSVVAASILAAGAGAYAGYDQVNLRKAKDIARVGDFNIENLKKSSPMADKYIAKGAEFSRRSSMSNAWFNDLRTYAVEGGDSDLIKPYGRKLHTLTPTKDIRVAGLRSQLDLLQSEYAGTIRLSTIKENAKLSISARRFINSLPDDKFANFTIENLRRTAWDGGEEGLAVVSNYIDLLKKRGYSAVNDINIPGSTARILFDRDAFAISK